MTTPTGNAERWFHDPRCGQDEYAEDDEGQSLQCPLPSRFLITRQDEHGDTDPTWGPAEACEQHFAGAYLSMLGGENAALTVTVHWDPS
jgi:hypothetical protein